MKRFSLLLLISLCIMSGCSSKTTAEKFEKIPINDLPQKYNPEMAVENGDYVNFYGEVSNEDAISNFLEKVENNEEAYIRAVRYTVEGDPMINDFYYNKDKFMVTTDNTRDAWGVDTAISEKEFKYLEAIVINTVMGTFTCYVVTNLEEINADNYSGEDSIVLEYIKVEVGEERITND